MTAPPEAQAPAVDLTADAQRARRGDRASGMAIARAYVGRVRNLARCLVTSDADADDVALAALTELMRRLKKFPEGEVFEPWADRTLVGIILGETHKPAAKSSVVTPFGTTEVVPPSPPPAERHYWSQRLAIRSVDTMPDELRVPHVLRHVVEMTVEEIAEATGTKPDAVQNATRAAHAKLVAARAVAVGSGTAARAQALSKLPDLAVLSAEPGPARLRPAAELEAMAKAAWEVGMPIPTGKREVPRWLAAVVLLLVLAAGAYGALEVRSWFEERPAAVSGRARLPAPKPKAKPAKAAPVVADVAAEAAAAKPAEGAAAAPDGGVMKTDGGTLLGKVEGATGAPLTEAAASPVPKAVPTAAPPAGSGAGPTAAPATSPDGPPSGAPATPTAPAPSPAPAATPQN